MKKKRKDGFTLIEVVIGVVLVALAFAGSMSLMAGMIRANAFSARMSTAVSLAQAAIDDLMEEQYDNVVSGGDTVDIYNRRWTVTTSAGFKDVNVTVTWPTIDGQTRRVALNTMVDD
jgi:prepilin-type N-terminal cleavage/methylation domain-containing protein